MPQPSKVEYTRSVRHAPLSVLEGGARSGANTARVVVAWCPMNDGGTTDLEPTQVELEAELETTASTTWTCRQSSNSGWAEALSAAHCREVVLTALNDDLHAKHLVFELAGLLALKLAATQPLIRVRFLPSAARAKRRSARYGTV